MQWTEYSTYLKMALQSWEPEPEPVTEMGTGSGTLILKFWNRNRKEPDPAIKLWNRNRKEPDPVFGFWNRNRKEPDPAYGSENRNRKEPVPAIQSGNLYNQNGKKNNCSQPCLAKLKTFFKYNAVNC